MLWFYLPYSGPDGLPIPSCGWRTGNQVNHEQRKQLTTEHIKKTYSSLTFSNNFPLKLGLDTQLAMGMGHGGGHSPSPEDDEEEYDYDYDYNMVKLTIVK